MLFRTLTILSFAAAVSAVPIAGNEYPVYDTTTGAPEAPTPTAGTPAFVPMQAETVIPELLSTDPSLAGANVPTPTPEVDDELEDVQKMLDDIIAKSSTTSNVQAPVLPTSTPAPVLTATAGTPPVAPMPCSTPLPVQFSQPATMQCQSANDCPAGECCSEFGNCGKTPEYCNGRSKPSNAGGMGSIFSPATANPVPTPTCGCANPDVVVPTELPEEVNSFTGTGVFPSAIPTAFPGQAVTHNSMPAPTPDSVMPTPTPEPATLDDLGSDPSTPDTMTPSNPTAGTPVSQNSLSTPTPTCSATPTPEVPLSATLDDLDSDFPTDDTTPTPTPSPSSDLFTGNPDVPSPDTLPALEPTATPLSYASTPMSPPAPATTMPASFGDLFGQATPTPLLPSTISPDTMPTPTSPAAPCDTNTPDELKSSMTAPSPTATSTPEVGNVLSGGTYTMTKPAY